MYILGANMYILSVHLYILGANKSISGDNMSILGGNMSISDLVCQDQIHSPYHTIPGVVKCHFHKM